MVSQESWQLFMQLALPGLPLVLWSGHAGQDNAASALRLLAHLDAAILAPVVAVQTAFVVTTH
jgi:hypothetical protein